MKQERDVTPAMVDMAQRLLGGSADRTVLQFYLNQNAAAVIRYCRLRELHPDLRNVVVSIACDRFRRQSPGSAESPQEVSSITDKDQSISYRSSGGEAILSTGFTQSESALLNQYRKVWRE